MTKSFLVADIGGTNSRFSIFQQNLERLEQLDSIWLKTDSCKSFIELLESLKTTTLLKRVKEFSAVTVAAAGPVDRQGVCYPPNIKWTLSLGELRQFFPNTRISLINDFLAQSFAVLTPIIAEAKIIKEGTQENFGVLGVIGPGTGLGKSILSISSSGDILGLPSEGGHITFAAISRDEFEVVNFLRSKLKADYLTAEQMISGRSLALLYEFFYEKELSVIEVAEIIKSGHAPLVVNSYSKYLGRVCRDFALDIFANMGIIIAGGVLSKTPEILNSEIFASEFVNSKTQERFLNGLQVSNFFNEDSGLWGAAKYASQLA